MSTRPLWTLDQVVAWVREHPDFSTHDPMTGYSNGKRVGAYALLIKQSGRRPMLAGLFSSRTDKEPEGVCEAKLLPEALRELAFHSEVKKMSVH